MRRRSAVRIGARRALVAAALLGTLALSCGSERGVERAVAGTSAAATSASSAEHAAPSLRGPASASAAAPASPSAPEPPKPARAAGPPRAVDLHVDTPWQVKFKGRSPELPEGQGRLEALVAGRYAGVVYPIYIADHLHGGHPTIADGEAILETIGTILEKNGHVLWPATKGPTPDGKITAWISIEGAGAFATDVAKIDRFVERGVVLVGPVHAHDNDLATSATGKDKKRGLSELGRDFCERVYDRGALVDVSHMSDRAFDDLASIAERRGLPIVATHSSSRALADHPRNLTDAQLARIAKSGGVAGVNFHGGFLRVGGDATLDDAVKHTLHMIEVAGIDHVGLGSDFDGGNPPAELADASRMPAFAEALRRAGLSEGDVRKVFEDNALRILRLVEERRRRASGGE